jgi:hypothetical protein
MNPIKNLAREEDFNQFDKSRWINQIYSNLVHKDTIASFNLTWQITHIRDNNITEFERNQ